MRYAEQNLENFLLKWVKTTSFNNCVFAVGGYVRDQILNKPSKDLDIVVNQENGAKEFTQFLHKNFMDQTSQPYEIGAGYPIWHIAFKHDIEFEGETFEVTGARLDVADTQKEAFPDINSRQRITEFGTIEDDAIRRDFTSNSLYKNLSNGELYDITGLSLFDIRNGIIQCNPQVSPEKIFNDDPLRMLRAIVFKVRFDWTITNRTWEAIKRNAYRIQIISKERILEELKKTIMVKKFYQAIELIDEATLLNYILPEIVMMKSVNQSKKHHAEGSVYNHTIEVLKHAPNNIIMQFSSLLHDVGKFETYKKINGEITFHGHEKIGSDKARVILQGLKFDTYTIERISKIIDCHMRPLFLMNNGPNGKAVRRFIRDAGDLLDDILDLAEADANGSLPVKNHIPELRKKIVEINSSPNKPSNKAILDGNEIMNVLNIQSGKLIGEIIQFLFDKQDEYAEAKKDFTKDVAKSLIVEKFR